MTLTNQFMLKKWLQYLELVIKAIFVQKLEETRAEDPTTRYSGTGLLARLRLWFKQNL